MPETCSDCGQQTSRYTIEFKGDGPALAHCRTHRSPVITGHKPFESYLDTNIDERPVEITSSRQMDRLMRKNNLAVRPREHIDDLNQRRLTRGLPPVRK